MRQPSRLKEFPIHGTDEEAERFVESADLSQYDFAGFRPMQFEFERKAAQLNMRVPQPLFDAVKKRAEQRGIPYTRYIRELMERDIVKQAASQQRNRTRKRSS